MASSGYTAITFVANEQPTTAKWNLIGSNDASFNNGNGFEDGIIIDRHIAAGALKTAKISNISKFVAYRNAAQNSGSGGFNKVSFDAERFDTNSDFNTANGRFVAPVTGFYLFAYNVGVPITGAGADNVAVLYKNGVIDSWGIENSSSSGTSGAILISAIAGDYFEVYVATVNSVPLNVGATPLKTYFSGMLISAT